MTQRTTSPTLKLLPPGVALLVSGSANTLALLVQASHRRSHLTQSLPSIGPKALVPADGMSGILIFDLKPHLQAIHPRLLVPLCPSYSWNAMSPNSAIHWGCLHYICASILAAKEEVSFTLSTLRGSTCKSRMMQPGTSLTLKRVVPGTALQVSHSASIYSILSTLMLATCDLMISLLSVGSRSYLTR